MGLLGRIFRKGKAGKRRVSVTRNTTETRISVELTVDGEGKSKIKTGVGFLDHMLELFSFWGHFDLEIKAEGDLKVDMHHTNEDIGIVLGQAFKKALGDKAGIKRMGSASVPMEEVTASVAIDICGRSSFKLDLPVQARGVIRDEEQYKVEYAEHFFESLSQQLGANINIKIENPSPDLHASLEPAFKALGIALDQATQIDPRRKGIPSTKGVID
ncbi:MAG: imidazoleglycerol-phosphate dehydratase HisB [Candidatus Omnitrophica bacterium]|nr:imidazoleglycerol-phosphate dehydratase HisB [Candidatus Omnitrophota bacterium]MDD5770995.1 imidazoleglycerol-phosphate dehydratase HisB [Candidatus Omnitrophota bacterium]